MNHYGSVDFMSDALVDGQRITVLFWILFSLGQANAKRIRRAIQLNPANRNTRYVFVPDVIRSAVFNRKLAVPCCSIAGQTGGA